MFNFDEEKFLKVENGALGLKSDIEKVVDEVSEKGYSNIFFIGIGGTIAYAYQIV